MSEKLDYIIESDHIYIDGKFTSAFIGIKDGIIHSISDSKKNAHQKIDAKNLYVIPGAVDTQVHFREPGHEYKEDIQTGTKQALKGGITGVFEMPNTDPPTTTAAALNDKINRSLNRAWCDFAFYVGATSENFQNLPDLEKMSGCCGIKLFMGSSTGSLLLTNEKIIEQILKSTHKIVAVHAEDNQRLTERKHIALEASHPAAHPIWRDETTALLATQKIVRLAEKTNHRIHILHISTSEEMDFLREHKKNITTEVTPQHLTLIAPDCYEQFGTLAQMNPPIRSQKHFDGLWNAVKDGTVSVIGSDHAPHTNEEKQKPYPDSPSGMPGVQTLLPLMLDHVAQGKISIERLTELVAVNPCKIFGIKNRGEIKKGFLATLTFLDLKEKRTIEESWLASKVRWSPFAGKHVTGWPKGVMLGGSLAMWNDEIIGQPMGKVMEFIDGSHIQ